MPSLFKKKKLKKKNGRTKSIKQDHKAFMIAWRRLAGLRESISLLGPFPLKFPDGKWLSCKFIKRERINGELQVW